MGNLFAEIINKLMLLILTLLGIVVFLNIVNDKFKSKFINYVITLFGYILFVVISIFILIFFIGIFIFTFMITNHLLQLIIKVFIIESIAIYLALTISLIIFAYLPGCIGYYFLNIISFNSNRLNNLSNLYNNFIKFVRPKLLIYIFAFLLSITSSIETISSLTLINVTYWTSISNYILEAIITFLAFDTIMTYIDDNKDEILKDIKSLRASVSKLIKNKDF